MRALAGLVEVRLLIAMFSEVPFCCEHNDRVTKFITLPLLQFL